MPQKKPTRPAARTATRPAKNGAPKKKVATRSANSAPGSKQAGAHRAAARPSAQRSAAARPTARTSARTPAKAAPKRAPAGRPTAGGATPAPGAGQPDRRLLQASLLEIIRKTSAELPPDVVDAIARGRAAESEGSNALWAMKVIEENITLACDKSQPLCQDTGTIIFFVKLPKGIDERVFRRLAENAVATATEKGYLRQNSVDSLTGRNSGNNLGPGSPVFHIHTWDKPGMDIRLVLKGGGCENMGAQYSLPDTRLGAGRDLAGVEKCLLDAAYQAQGKGCGPGVLGVAVGGDRATGYEESKRQFLRTLDDGNPVPELAGLETRVTEKCNELGIGPMGFGGKTTLLGCKIGVLNRLPASYFVSVSYMCWAYRRQGAELDAGGTIRRWLY